MSLDPLLFKSLFYKLLIAFFLLTMVGTLSHEMGHCSMAALLGHQPVVHYNSMTWNNPTDFNKRNAETSYRDFEEMEISEHSAESLLVSLAGPASTILVGSLGFIGVLNRRRKRRQEPVTTEEWILIFFSLFWMRQVFNFIRALMLYITDEKFPLSGDEVNLAILLDWNKFSINLPTALVGATIIGLLIFKLMPLSERRAMILSGCIGGPAGYICWMHWLGPIVLP